MVMLVPLCPLRLRLPTGEAIGRTIGRRYGSGPSAAPSDCGFAHNAICGLHGVIFTASPMPEPNAGSS